MTCTASVYLCIGKNNFIYHNQEICRQDLEGSSKGKKGLENHSLKCGGKLKFKLNTLGSIGMDPLSRDMDKRPAPMDTIMNPRVS